MTKKIKQKEEFSMQDALIRVCQDETINPERLEKFLDLQIKMEERQAKTSFQVALSNFQAECPIIDKTKSVNFTAKSGKTTKYNYSPLDEIVYKIKPILAKNGLSFTFDTEKIEGDQIKLLTTIYHSGGYEKTFSHFFKQFHDDQRMNESQRSKSAITFAKRAALENALGIVTADEDDDMARHVDDPITDDQIEKINTLLEQTKTNLKKFTGHLKVNNLGELSEYEAKKGITQLKQKRAFMGGKNV
mgnify:CR=1 FL=1